MRKGFNESSLNGTEVDKGRLEFVKKINLTRLDSTACSETGTTYFFEVYILFDICFDMKYSLLLCHVKGR